MTDHTSGPRLGAALIIGATAERCVHVHTGPDGIAAIDARLRELNSQADAADVATVVPVVAVFGASRSALAEQVVYDVPADAVEDLAEMALELDR